jgi:hypothetical protein
MSPAQQTSPGATLPPDKIAATLKKFFEQIKGSKSANILAGPSANRAAASGISDKPELR